MSEEKLRLTDTNPDAYIMANILEELREIKELLAGAESKTYHVHIDGSSVDSDRLQKVLDDFRR